MVVAKRSQARARSRTSARLIRPLPMQFHPEGLHGNGAAVAEQARELGQGVAGPAAGVQDAQGVRAAGAAPGAVEQVGNQVHDPRRGWVVAAFWLSAASLMSVPPLSFNLDSVS